MEANICDINHLDADVLLPPRKRLLAGFKKESSYSNGVSDQPMVATPSPPSASSSNCSSSSEINTHLNHLLSSHLNNTCLSPEEVEASRAAAVAATKAAEAARAAAEEKAVIAAKAVAAAKSALELVASFSQETTSKDRHLKKNKLKKHVPVQQLYKKHRPIENRRKDEVFINSSPRMSSSEWKGHKHKRPRSLSFEKSKASTSFSSNGYAVAGVIDSEDSTQDIPEAKSGNGEAESSFSKEKATEVSYSPSKKRGRVKLKKLPLSLCSSRDQENGKEDSTSKTHPLNDGNPPTPGSKPLFSSEPSEGASAPPTWKCQEFNAPACIKQNKVLQS